MVRTHLPLFESQVATTLAGALQAEQGANLVALIFYGSRLNQTASAESDHDFFLIVEDYGAAFGPGGKSGVGPAFRRGGHLHAMACAILPPSVYRRRVRVPDGSEHACKISILSRPDFERGTSPEARDSYVFGRLGKRVALVWARDETARQGVEDAVCRAAALCGGWTLRGMQAPFSSDAFEIEALALSYRCEERLESWERAKILFAADEAYFRGVYGAFVAAAETAELARRIEPDGLLRVSGSREARQGERRMYARFLARSRRRARARWIKNMWTFEGWADYMISKIKRHHGIVIELSPRERRFPLLAAVRYYLRFRREKRLH